MSAHKSFDLKLAKSMKLDDWKKYFAHLEDKKAIEDAWHHANPAKEPAK